MTYPIYFGFNLREIEKRVGIRGSNKTVLVFLQHVMTHVYIYILLHKAPDNNETE